MNNKTVKFLKIVCYVMLALIPLWVIFYGVQSYFVLTNGTGEGVIHWDSPMIGLKLTMFIVHRIALLTMAGLFTAFIINILRYLKKGTIFNRTNVILLWIMVCVLAACLAVGCRLSVSLTGGTIDPRAKTVAIACPMPRPAPVTITTLSFSRQ